jgi:hypothetical protein
MAADLLCQTQYEQVSDYRIACHRQGAAYRLLGLRFRDDDVKARATLAVVC